LRKGNLWNFEEEEEEGFSLISWLWGLRVGEEWGGGRDWDGCDEEGRVEDGGSAVWIVRAALNMTWLKGTGIR
jgi:hypothetical protein